MMDVRDALRELRRRLQMTQQDLAVHLGKAVVTVARWETTRPPRGGELSTLMKLAVQHGWPDLAGVFAHWLGEDLEMRGERLPRTIEENAVADLLFTAMRNRHLPEVRASYHQALQALLSGLEAVGRSLRVGEKVRGIDDYGFQILESEARGLAEELARETGKQEEGA
jgi:transcriptional regulator with XRE-family HTH domain